MAGIPQPLEGHRLGVDYLDAASTHALQGAVHQTVDVADGDGEFVLGHVSGQAFLGIDDQQMGMPGLAQGQCREMDAHGRISSISRIPPAERVPLKGAVVSVLVNVNVLEISRTPAVSTTHIPTGKRYGEAWCCPVQPLLMPSCTFTFTNPHRKNGRGGGLPVAVTQYVGMAGSTSLAQAATPPSMLITLENPWCSRYRATCRLRIPW